MAKEYDDILEVIPHKKPFRFVDEITELSENHIIGNYTLPEKSFFFEGHFPNNAITPGVIILEIMAQIGLVAFGIHLNSRKKYAFNNIYFASSEVKYTNICYPKDKIIVVSEKIYFKFGKLKCYVEAKNIHDKILCSGILSGIIK